MLSQQLHKRLDLDDESLKHHIDIGTPFGSLITERTSRAIPRTPSGRIDERALEGHIEKTAELRAKWVTRDRARGKENKGGTVGPWG